MPLVQRLGFRVQGLGFRVRGLGSGVECVWFKVEDFGVGCRVDTRGL